MGIVCKVDPNSHRNSIESLSRVYRDAIEFQSIFHSHYIELILESIEIGLNQVRYFLLSRSNTNTKTRCTTYRSWCTIAATRIVYVTNNANTKKLKHLFRAPHVAEKSPTQEFRGRKSNIRQKHPGKKKNQSTKLLWIGVSLVISPLVKMEF